MDPLSITASVIAVIQITSVVSTHCMQYIKSARNTKSLILRLIQELGGLQIVLGTLQQLAQRGSCLLTEGEDSDSLDEKSYLLPTLKKLSQLEYIFEECYRKLEKLEREIVPSTHASTNKRDAFFKALHWPLKEAYMRSIMEDINHYISLFSLALTLDETDNVLDIRETTFETHSMVKLLHTQKEDENRRQHGETVIKWLGAPDSSIDYAHALRLKTTNTGIWLTERKEYQEWQKNPHSLFWIHGIAGSGKTILSSTVIDDLLKNNESDVSSAAAYFYFKGDDKDKTTCTGMLLSLLRQLFDRGNRTSKVFDDALSKGIQQLALEQLHSLLKTISTEFQDVYIVLDALDECQDLEKVFDTLEEINTWTDSNVHVLLTSRETKDIKEFIDGLEVNKYSIRLSAAVVKQDIRMYIRDRLRTDRNLKRWRSHPKVQEEIENSLVESSDGMFQWVMFQLLSFVDCRKPQELRQALRTMPKGLNDTYAQILSRISDKDYEIAMRILYWLLFSARPLHVDELAELAAIDLDTEPFDDIERLWDPMDVLNICPHLLTTVEENSGDESGEPRLLVRLAHISIREYLLSSEILKGTAARFHVEKANAQAEITDCCLRYLRLVKTTVDEAVEEFPLATYAATHWLFHYGKVPEDKTRTHERVLEFFIHQKEAYSKWVTYVSSASPPLFHPALISPVPLSPLDVASAYSMTSVLKMMLKRDDIDTKSESVLQRALRAAYLRSGPSISPHNKVPTIRMLLDQGANFAGDAKFATALHAASYFGFDEIVKVELQEGAEVNKVCGDYVTALQAAVVGRHDRYFFETSGHNWPISGWLRPGYVFEDKDPETVKILLENGANPNICGGADGSSLLAACTEGDLPCVKLLLAYGADPNFGKKEDNRWKQSCLAAACRSGDHRIVQLLFEHGARTDSPVALSSAIGTADLDMVRLLLEKGFDPNSERVSDETPLQIACFGCRPKIVEWLLQYGADASIGGGRFGFPLQNACAFYGSVETLKVLVTHGVDVNQCGGAFGTALHAAAFYGDPEMVDYLISQGADIHAKGVMFDSVLRHAIQNGHTEIFRILLKAGADMETPEGRYGKTLREMLAGAPLDKNELWLRTYQETNPQFPSETLCAIVRQGEGKWQDFDQLVLEDRGAKRDVDPLQWDCLLPGA